MELETDVREFVDSYAQSAGGATGRLKAMCAIEESVARRVAELKRQKDGTPRGESPAEADE